MTESLCSNCQSDALAAVGEIASLLVIVMGTLVIATEAALRKFKLLIKTLVATGILLQKIYTFKTKNLMETYQRTVQCRTNVFLPTCFPVDINLY